jgi:hypothetical protein
MPTKIQLRRDTAADWTSNNPTLAAGEFGWESDTSKYKIGDGSTAWNSLGYTSEKFDSITITDNTIKTNVSNANLELDANGSGKVSISGLLYPTSDGSADQVLKTDGSGNLSFVAQSGGGVSLATSTNNQVATVTGSNALTGESNLTFDGSTLTLTGSAALDGVTITDNLISTNRSNDNLNISANGTGDVVITQSNNYPGLSNNPRNVMYYEDAATTFGTRNYSNNIYGVFKIDSGQSDSSSSNDRYRNVFYMELDLNGKDSTGTSSALTRGPQNAMMTIVNNTASGNSTLGNANGAQNLLSPRTEGSGDLTITESAAHSSSVEADAASGTTITLTDTYGYHSSGYLNSGSGTHAVTNFTHFYAQTNRDASSITNEYAFYSEDDTAKSRVGTLERYREKINSLTSSSTISVECSQAPVHKVTLAQNTQFVIQDLGAGQSVTIIITQDGTGSKTASFGTGDSTAVKFAGGTPALSTAASAIDIVTIFNDGTNFYGNIAKAYA